MIVTPWAWMSLIVRISASTFALGQAARDLIEQQELGLGGHGPRQLEPLALQQRQLTGGHIGAFDQLGAFQNVGAVTLHLAL